MVLDSHPEFLHVQIPEAEFLSLSSLFARASIYEEQTAEVEQAKVALRSEIGKPVHVFPQITQLERNQITPFANVVEVSTLNLVFYVVTQPVVLTASEEELTVQAGEVIVTADTINALKAVQAYFAELR